MIGPTEATVIGAVIVLLFGAETLRGLLKEAKKVEKEAEELKEITEFLNDLRR